MKVLQATITARRWVPTREPCAKLSNRATLPRISAATAALVNAEKSTHRVEVLAQGAGGVLSRLFRRLFLEYLLKAFDAGKLEFFSSLESLRDRCSFLDYLAPLREAEW